MIEPNKLTEEQKKNLEEFLEVTFLFDDEQFKAINRQIHMTQTLFESCINRCVEIGVDKQLFRLMNDFPNLLETYINRIEEEIKNIELPEKTPEKEQVRWDKLVTEIRARYGENAI